MEAKMLENIEFIKFGFEDHQTAREKTYLNLLKDLKKKRKEMITKLLKKSVFKKTMN